jgi:hypothetical protein
MSRENDALERIRKYHASLEAPPGNWEAKRTLARAVRGLMDSLCATDAPPSELLAIAAQVEASARRFADQPRMIDPPGVAEGSLGGGMEMFMDRSPLVGLANPVAPPLRLDPNPETRIVLGGVTFGNAYEGAPGCVHGGHVAAVFDEALGMACIFSGVPGMTGEITVSYRKPTPIHVTYPCGSRPDSTAWKAARSTRPVSCTSKARCSRSRPACSSRSSATSSASCARRRYSANPIWTGIWTGTLVKKFSFAT